MKDKCQAKTEVWTRCVGYFSPVAQWNRGKKEEYKERLPYVVDRR
jgi:ribonucleoside-triphosphate reductase